MVGLETDKTLDRRGKAADVRERRDVRAPADGDRGYLGKVLVYIPIESIALYQAALNQLGADDPFFRPIVTFIWILTPFWLLYATHKQGQPLAWDQAVTSVPAFAFWLAGLQSPYIIESMKAWAVVWKEGYGTFALILGSMLLPVIGSLVLWIVKQIKQRPKA